MSDIFTNQQIHNQFLKLMHRGRAWARDSKSNLHKFTASLMPTFTRLLNAASAMPVDTNPGTTVNLLPEWELTLGLPDECLGAAQSFGQRQAMVKARFQAEGGQTVHYLERIASNLGYPVTVEEFSATDTIWDNAFLNAAPQFILRITADIDQIIYFRTGVAVASDPLRKGTISNLECEMRRYAPAHVYLVYSYVGSWQP